MQLSAKAVCAVADRRSGGAQAAERHLRGFADARHPWRWNCSGCLPARRRREPLQFKPSNPKVTPVPARGVAIGRRDAGRHDAGLCWLQADNLDRALRAAYNEALAALDDMQTGKGAALLLKTPQNRVLRAHEVFEPDRADGDPPRLHEKEAAIMLDDEEVEFVQIRRRAKRRECLHVQPVRRAGQVRPGKGCVPKRAAPVPPYHPFCKCKMVPGRT